MTWRLVPLYGLQLRGIQEGNTNPVFGDDATIVGVDAVASAVVTVMPPEHAGLFIGGKMRPHAEKLTQRPPMETFIDFSPHSFIAVRRTGKGVRPYAESILAMLSASIYYHADMIAGFSIDPLSQIWGIFVHETGWNKEIQFEALFDIFQNKNTRHVPLNITEDKLRRSWNDGTPILDNPWRVHKGDAYTKLFIGRAETLNTMQRELREAGIAIALAHTTRPSMAQVLFAVSAIEQIFRTRDFKELTKILLCFFTHQNHRVLIAEIFDARHVFAHRARGEQGERADLLANLALRMAWICLEIGVTGAELYPTPEKWLEFLRRLVSTREMADHFENSLGKPDVAASMRLESIPPVLREIRKDATLDSFSLTDAST